MALAIVIILNVIFFALLIAGFLIGIKRGVEYSALHLGFIFVGLIISLLISAPISKLFLNINIGGQSLYQTLSQSLGGVTAASSTLEGLTSGLVAAIFMPFVMIVVSAILCSIMEIFYQLVSRRLLRKKELIKTNQKIKYVGGLVGLFEMFVVLIFIFMPFTSLSSTVTEITTKQGGQSATVSATINNIIPKEIKDIVVRYSKSPMGVTVKLGGFDDVFYDGVAYIGNGAQTSLKKDVLPTLNAVDDIVAQFNQVVEDSDAGDYEKLKTSVSSVLKSPLITKNIDDIYNELITNKEKLLEQLNLTSNLKYSIADAIDNFEYDLKDEDIVDYLDQNASIFIDGFEALAKSGAYQELMFAINGANGEVLMEEQYISGFNEAIKILIEAPIVEEIYPILDYVVNNLPSAVLNVIDVEELVDFQTFKSEVIKVLDVAADLANDTTSNSTLLKEVLYGDGNLIYDLLHSPNAEKLVGKLTNIKSLKSLVFSSLYNMDNKIKDLLNDLGQPLNPNDFKSTIQYSDSLEKQHKFLQLTHEQSGQLIDIGKQVLDGNFSSETLPQLLDELKQLVAKDGQNSIFYQTFDNLINYFSGKMKASKSDEPAFGNSELFLSRVDDAFEQINTDGQLDESEKFYLVSYSDIFDELI